MLNSVLKREIFDVSITTKELLLFHLEGNRKENKKWCVCERGLGVGSGGSNIPSNRICCALFVPVMFICFVPLLVKGDVDDSIRSN